VNKILQADWLKCQTFFDFDTVEIGQATDEAIERLMMQVKTWYGPGATFALFADELYGIDEFKVI
jgi:hypothetical protein